VSVWLTYGLRSIQDLVAKKYTFTCDVLLPLFVILRKSVGKGPSIGGFQRLNEEPPIFRAVFLPRLCSTSGNLKIGDKHWHIEKERENRTSPSIVEPAGTDLRLCISCMRTGSITYYISYIVYTNTKTC